MTSTEKQEKLSKLYQEISQLSEEKTHAEVRLFMLEDERRALEATPVTTPHKVWEPARDEKYWYSSHVDHTTNFNTEGIDRPMIAAGLANPTKEAAERHHSFLVMLHDLHKFAVEHNEGWKPVWGESSTNANWTIVIHNNIMHPEGYRVSMLSILPYFKTRELAQKAIDTFGDRLKILFEYYNS